MERKKLLFLLADKHQRFVQIDTIIIGVTRHAQITQNNKFAIFLQYLKKKVSDEVDLLHASKHESSLQIDTMTFDGDSQAFPKFPIASLQCLQYLKKEVRDEVDFLHADKHQNFPQVNSNTLSIKVFYKMILSLLMGIINHSQSTQSNKLSLDLQYFKNEVSRKTF